MTSPLILSMSIDGGATGMESNCITVFQTVRGNEL